MKKTAAHIVLILTSPKLHLATNSFWPITITLSIYCRLSSVMCLPFPGTHCTVHADKRVVDASLKFVIKGVLSNLHKIHGGCKLLVLTYRNLAHLFQKRLVRNV